MTSVSKCTARVRIGDSDFIGRFVVLPQCCRDLIIGMDFLIEHDAVIDVGEGFVRFFMIEDPPETTGNRPTHLQIVDGDVSLPPRTCMLVSVEYDDLLSGSGISQVLSFLLLDSGIAIAMGLVTLACGEAEILLANFTNER